MKFKLMPFVLMHCASITSAVPQPTIHTDFYLFENPASSPLQSTPAYGDQTPLKQIVPVQWESLGGIATSPVSALSWRSNRIDLFVTGTGNDVEHKWWNGQEWGGWESLGGIATSPVSAVSWGSNRIDLFVKGTGNAVEHNWWNGQQWNP